MARLPELDPKDMTAEQRKAHDAIMASPRGKVEGPLKVWLHSPQLADRAQALGAHCRYFSVLPQRLSELAIIIVGAHWRAGFEWFVHAPIAIEAGIDPVIVETIRKGGKPAFKEDDEAAVHDFCRELLTDRKVTQATYDRACSLLGNQAVVDLTGVLGYYTLISMTINAFEVDIPDGGADPFADLDPQ
jgi:4-carboxymuconolactone decarboxylase